MTDTCTHTHTCMHPRTNSYTRTHTHTDTYTHACAERDVFTSMNTYNCQNPIHTPAKTPHARHT